MPSQTLFHQPNHLYSNNHVDLVGLDDDCTENPSDPTRRFDGGLKSTVPFLFHHVRMSMVSPTHSGYTDLCTFSSASIFCDATRDEEACSKNFTKFFSSSNNSFGTALRRLQTNLSIVSEVLVHVHPCYRLSNISSRRMFAFLRLFKRYNSNIANWCSSEPHSRKKQRLEH